MKIALIGSDGIPARYGGFETFVEQVVPHLVALGDEVMVVGSSLGRSSSPPAIAGVRIVNLPLPANGALSVAFDIVSFARAAFWADAVVLLGVSAGLFVPVFKRLTRSGRLIVNVDGLESRRQKWAGASRRFLALSESVAVKHAPHLVADNEGIAALLTSIYRRESTVIAYGADHVARLTEEEAALELRNGPKLEPYGFALTIARIEPENNIDLMINAFLASHAAFPYVLVGNFARSEYGRTLRSKHRQERRLVLLDPIYQPSLLAALRSQCRVYLHGHSVGGTNPSLVEMLPYARPVLAWRCDFNCYTLRGSGGYFEAPSDLTLTLSTGDFERYIPPLAVREDHAYQWRGIAQRYSDLARSICN
jgi:glycosyltransferase involved in cell wall biosynthesis